MDLNKIAIKAIVYGGGVPALFALAYIIYLIVKHA